MASDRDTLAALIADLGYDLDRGPRVADWPEDEREYHRRVDWPSFEARAAAMQVYRRDQLAGSILAAGWRPPPQVITTAEERDALPAGCMVKQLTTGTIYRRAEDITTVPRLGMCAEIRRSPGDWYDANGNCCFDLDLPSYPTIGLPLEVLYVPAEEADLG